MDKTIILIRMLQPAQAFIYRWNSYSKKNLYARDIKFEDVIDNGINIIEKIKNQ